MNSLLLICFLKSATVFSSEALQFNDFDGEYKKLFPEGQQLQRNFDGLSLNGTERELQSFTEILSENPPSSWSEKAQDCQHVRCALSALTGSEEAAKRIMNIQARTGYVLTMNQKYHKRSRRMVWDKHLNAYETILPEGDKVWSLDEVRVVDDTLHLLPDKFYHLKHHKHLYALEKNFFILQDERRVLKERPMTTAYTIPARYQKGKMVEEGSVVFFPYPYHTLEREIRAYETVAHELAHALDQDPSYIPPGRRYSEQNAYQEAICQGSEQKGCVQEAVTEYGDTHVHEDFAEAQAHYIFHAKQMKKGNPLRYQYMKDRIFGGREYLELQDQEEEDPSRPSVRKIPSSQAK